MIVSLTCPVSVRPKFCVYTAGRKQNTHATKDYKDSHLYNSRLLIHVAMAQKIWFMGFYLQLQVLLLYPLMGS